MIAHFVQGGKCKGVIMKEIKKALMNEFLAAQEKVGSPSFFLGARYMLDFLLDEKNMSLCPYTVCQKELMDEREIDGLNMAIRLLATHPLPRIIFKSRVYIVDCLKSIRRRFT